MSSSAQGLSESQLHVTPARRTQEAFTLNRKMIVPYQMLIVISVSLFGIIKAASIYDQSQTGEFNVQVDVRDIQIITLMKSGKEEYVDYDYAYDYSEMTIKPQNGTTPKPLNVSNTIADVLKDNTTVATTVYVETTSEYIKNSTQKPDTKFTDQPVVTESTTQTKIADDITTKSTVTENSSTPETAAPVANVTINNCKKGFILNQKGACEFKLQSASNALLKIIKLSQKLKRRENRQQPGDE